MAVRILRIFCSHRKSFSSSYEMIEKTRLNLVRDFAYDFVLTSVPVCSLDSTADLDVQATSDVGGARIHAT